MKKTLLVGAAATALALASCAKTETVDVRSGEGITFGTSVGRSLRTAPTNANDAANVVTNANLAAFKVTAYQTNGANYFTNLDVTKSGTNWNTATTYYWPQFELNFVGYAPTDLATVSIDKDNQKITGFSPAAAIADQKDVLMAYNKGSRSDFGGGANAVNMHFKHILSQVEIKARCSNPNMKVEVLGVKLGNINSAGDFILPVTDITKSSVTIPVTAWTTKTPTNYFNTASQTSEAKTLTNQYQRIMFGDNNFIILPQAITAWAGDTNNTGSFVSVLIRLSSKNGASSYIQIYPNHAGKFGFAAVPFGPNFKFEPGKKYTINLDFCGTDSGAGQLDPTPEYGVGTETPGTIDPSVIDKKPMPKKADTPEGDQEPAGTPILKPIKFTVSVDEWVDADPVNINMQ